MFIRATTDIWAPAQLDECGQALIRTLEAPGVHLRNKIRSPHVLGDSDSAMPGRTQRAFEHKYRDLV